MFQDVWVNRFLRHSSVANLIIEFPTLGRNTRIQTQGVYVCMNAEIVNTRMTIKPKLKQSCYL